MARRSSTTALLWPAGLVLLVVLLGVLAFFQYKWLGQVSESERDRLRATLNQRARDFAEDFDREISRIYSAFQVDDAIVSGEQWGTFAERYDTWRAAAHYPQLVQNIYISAAPAAPMGEGPAAPALLRQFDPGARGFRAITWPAELAPVRERVVPNIEHSAVAGISSAIRFVTVSGSPVVASVPALVIPVQSATPLMPSLPSALAARAIAFRIGPANVIVELDRRVLVQTILPELVARHFSNDYRVAVSETQTPNQPFFTTVQTPAEMIGKEPDASVGFFGVRTDVIKDVIALRQSAATVAGMPMPALPSATLSNSSGRFSIVVDTNRGEKVSTTAANVVFGASAWRLVLQHPDGSLEAAVTKARRRNLSLSFGVLAVLAVSVVLISINAQRAQRLAAQQMDFVATVSHELRTPLAVIRSAAQNLSAGIVHEPAQAKKYGELIDAEGRRLSDMVEQVLSYAGLSDAKRQLQTAPCDIVAITRDVVSSCADLIRDTGCTVELDAPDAALEVPLDDASYRRALQNLIGNALKYGSDGRWLGVRVAAGTGPGGRAEVHVTVTDRGRGIDPADLPHLFDAFYRGRDAKEQQIHGNGLGLSLVKGIAEAHGGRVSVTSTPGAGASFTMAFPA
mgnify:CR=1 FL=1